MKVAPYLQEYAEDLGIRILEGRDRQIMSFLKGRARFQVTRPSPPPTDPPPPATPKPEPETPKA